MSGTLASLAGLPVQRREFTLDPAQRVAPGQASMGNATQHFVPLDTVDPTAQLALRLGIGQTVPETSRLYGMATDAAGFSGGLRAYHGGPGSFEWAAPNSQRGAITQWDVRGPEGAVFAAKSPGRASEYAVARYPDRPAVYPLDIDDSAVLRWDQMQGFRTNRELAEMARERGARVVEINNTYDSFAGSPAEAQVRSALGRPLESGPETIYMVLDPSAIGTPFGRR